MELKLHHRNLPKKKKKPKRYWFQLNFITVILEGKLSTSVSFRAISQLFSIFALCINLKVRTPSHTTVMNWVVRHVVA